MARPVLLGVAVVHLIAQIAAPVLGTLVLALINIPRRRLVTARRQHHCAEHRAKDERDPFAFFHLAKPGLAKVFRDREYVTTAKRFRM